MIKINLLPQEMAGGRAGAGAPSGGAGSALVFMILLIVFVLDAAIAGVLFVNWNKAKSEYESVKKQSDAVAKELKETEVLYSETKSSLERMSKLIAVARALDPPDRLLWSRKLNALPLLVPEGVFLTQVQVKQKVSEKETPESLKRRNEWEKSTNKNKGPAPIKEMVPLYQQTLTVDGVAYVQDGTDNQRLQQIVRFQGNLRDGKVKLPFDKETTSFMDGFIPTVIPSPLSGTQLEGRDVTNFKFTINTKQSVID